MSDTTGDILVGKRGLIMGVANEKSIAWGIAAAAAVARMGKLLVVGWLEEAGMLCRLACCFTVAIQPVAVS